MPRTTKTQQGNPAIIDSSDYIYIIGKVFKEKTMGWRCRSYFKGCKARLTTLKETGYVIKASGYHNHDPPLPKE